MELEQRILKRISINGKKIHEITNNIENKTGLKPKDIREAANEIERLQEQVRIYNDMLFINDDQQTCK